MKLVMALANAGCVMELVKSGTCLRTPIGALLVEERADVIRVAAWVRIPARSVGALGL